MRKREHKTAKKSNKVIVVILIISLILSLCTMAFQYLYYNGYVEIAAEPAAAVPTPTIRYLKDYETTIYVFKQETKCLFTGTLDNEGNILGDAHFEIYSSDEPWYFDGETKNRSPWKGTAENYPMKFGNDAVQYDCKYTGDIVDGIPNGTGTLRVEGTDGNDFTYEGEWKDGLYDGYGELVYDNALKLNNIGHFEKGVFKPTFIELTEILFKGSKVTLSDEQKEYISSIEDSIVNHDTNALNFGSGFSFGTYVKDQKNDDNRCFTTHIKIVSAIEYPESIFGMPVTEIVGYSHGVKYIFHGFYYGTSEKLKEGNNLKVAGYPLNYGPYSSLSTTEAFNFILLSIIK